MIRRKIMPLALSLGVASVLLGGCGLGGNNKNVEQGMAAIANQDYEAALACFDTAADAGEDKRLIDRGRGIAHMGQLEYETALSDFENALHASNGLIKPVDYDISYYLAMTEYKLGQLDEAQNTYSAIINLDDEAADAYYLRGKVELLKGDKEAAIADYDKAVAIKSSDYDMYIKIYEDLFSCSYENEAMRYIDMAMENNSRMNDYQQGLMLYYKGNYDEARSCLEKAREDDDSAILILSLGKCYEALGDVNYATGLYTSYIEKNEGDAAIFNQLGLMKLKQEDYKSALEAFEKGLALADSSYNQSLMFNEIVAYEYLNDFKKASVCMQEYLKMYPEDWEALREYDFLKTR